MAITWSDLFVNGTLINYSQHFWRAKEQLTAEDLGIQESTDVKRAISFGSLKLAPKESFDSLNTIAREWEKDIKFHSLAFPLLTSVRYVPDSEVKNLEKKLKVHTENFQKEVKAFLLKFSVIKEQQLAVIKQALIDAAQSEKDALEAYQRVCAEYPDEEKVESKFLLEWNFFTINIPSSKQAATMARRAAPQIQEVLTSMVSELRSELSSRITTLIDMTKKIQEGSSRFSGLNPKNKEATNAILDRVNSLNFFDDPVIRRQVANLKDLLENDNLDQVLVGLTQANETINKDVEKAVEKAKIKIGKRKLTLD